MDKTLQIIMIQAAEKAISSALLLRERAINFNKELNDETAIREYIKMLSEFREGVIRYQRELIRAKNKG